VLNIECSQWHLTSQWTRHRYRLISGKSRVETELDSLKQEDVSSRRRKQWWRQTDRGTVSQAAPVPDDSGEAREPLTVSGDHVRNIITTNSAAAAAAAVVWLTDHQSVCLTLSSNAWSTLCAFVRSCVLCRAVMCRSNSWKTANRHTSSYYLTKMDLLNDGVERSLAIYISLCNLYFAYLFS